MNGVRAGSLLCPVLVVAVAPFGCAGPRPTPAQSPVPCASLLALQLKGTVVTSATVVAPTGTLPEYCDVLGAIDTTIGVEIRLPTRGWNGKLWFGGNGGFAGHLRHDTSTGLSRRYATVSTDTGHQVRVPELDVWDASWAFDAPGAELDFAHRAVHLAAVVGREVVRAYYGTPPTRAYFQGCSNGGRQALEEAIRYPEDFDGVIAGDPVLDLTGTVLSEVWNLQAQHATETRGDLSLNALQTVGDAVLAACDAADGLVDGLVSDPERCRFTPRSLLCGNTQAGACLGESEVRALERIYGGPRTVDGAPLLPGLSPGGERPDGSKRGWDRWLLSTVDHTAEAFVFSQQFLRFLAFQSDRPTFVLADFDVGSDLPQMIAAASIMNATSVELDHFRGRGGKLLVHQGWSDAATPPLRMVAYVAALQARFGREATDAFARLFMLPGAHHCGGGPGPNELDALTALEHWVEQGQPPESIVAVHRDGKGQVDRARPLCPYPRLTTYDQRGDPDDVRSFRCSERGR
jgi:feruloyl esterase